MNKWIPPIMLICALAGLVWYFFIAVPGKSSTAVSPSQSESAVTTPGMPISSPQIGAAGSGSVSSGRAPAPTLGAVGASASSPAPSAQPFILGSADAYPSMDPATVLSNMRITIIQYGSTFGGNPVGTNPEIAKALNGDNPKQARFIKEELGLRINGRGELVDYWGTPFFFHQLSGTEMEIHSAGPDKVMWTADDLVTR
jgi:hypothetical protein